MLPALCLSIQYLMLIHYSTTYKYLIVYNVHEPGTCAAEPVYCNTILYWKLPIQATRLGSLHFVSEYWLWSTQDKSINLTGFHHPYDIMSFLWLFDIAKTVYMHIYATLRSVICYHYKSTITVYYGSVIFMIYLHLKFINLSNVTLRRSTAYTKYFNPNPSCLAMKILCTCTNILIVVNIKSI